MPAPSAIPEPASPGEAEASALASTADARLVARNTLWLVLSQFITTPLSLIVNGVMGRYLGASDFGLIYFLGTLTSFAFLVLEWGQGATLTSAVARGDPAGPLLGTTLLLRIPTALFTGAVCLGILMALGYPAETHAPFVLIFAQGFLSSVTGSVAAVLRGRERISLLVWLNAANAILGAVLPVAALLLGWKLAGWLWSSLLVYAICFAVSLVLLSRIHPGALRPDWQRYRPLLHAGTSFMVLGAVLALQPYVDAMILERMAPAQVVGWYAAARKIQNVVIFPSTTLSVALYPTLSRLRGQSETAWGELTGNALKVVAIFSVPASLGCLLFADVGVALFSKEAFAPTGDVLRALSAFIFLVYFNIVIGTALMAAGRQRAWAWAQSLCVLVSAIADPLLIPIFQQRTGNGGLGVAVSTVASEVLMLAAALVLIPRGALVKGVLSTVLRALVAGVAMAGVALALRSQPWPVSMTASLAVYALALFAVGGVGEEQRKLIGGLVMSRLRR